MSHRIYFGNKKTYKRPWGLPSSGLLRGMAGQGIFFSIFLGFLIHRRRSLGDNPGGFRADAITSHLIPLKKH
jgi:hypothetical protein